MRVIENLANRFKDGMKMQNKYLQKAVQKYKLIYYSDNFKSFDQDLEINMNQTPLIIIDQFKSENTDTICDYFIINIQNSIIIIEQILLNRLRNLFLKNKKKPKIFFLSNSKNNFDQNIKLDYQELESHSYFTEEIESFNTNINTALPEKELEIWNNIKSSISAYFLMKSYLKTKKDRISEFFSDQKKLPFEIQNPNEFIELRTIGCGLSNVCLIYHITKEELFALKKEGSGGNETSKLFEREIKNYKQINHPFISNFIGTYLQKNPVIEYINGNTLENIDKENLSDNEKITILCEIMLAIQYLHCKNYIYRDLKPSNIMIDENNTVVLIDFDRMIKYNKNSKDEIHTTDFNTKYMDPNVETDNFSFEVDIYSIGKIILYLMNETPSKNSSNEYNFENCKKMKDLYEQCMIESKEKRPAISKLIDEFYINFKSKILISTDVIKRIRDFNINSLPYGFGTILPNGQFVPDESFPPFSVQFEPMQLMDDGSLLLMVSEALLNGNQGLKKNINESIYQYTKLADSGNVEAQYKLGLLFLDGKEVPRNINKSIYYFNLASNSNYSPAKYYLGLIFIENKYVKRDFNKAIQYLKGAETNHAESQYLLGCIYNDVNYANHDYDKAIHYFTLAANHNHLYSQYKLGLIYSISTYSKHDFNKAIYYFTMASYQNFGPAQYILGSIYYDDVFVSRDINKAVHYLTLAANNGIREAQFSLSNIFIEGKYISKDINKGLHYLTLSVKQDYLPAHISMARIYYDRNDVKKAIYHLTIAAKQNNDEAQKDLGLIFYEDIREPKDINKAIYYFTLSANQNNRIAQYYLGLIFLETNKNKNDIAKAIEYFTLSANQNYVYAQRILGIIYYKSNYVKMNIEKSIYYFTHAANQNDTKSLYNLYEIYYSGQFVQQNITKAMNYLNIAASLNDSDAQFILGMNYYLSSKNIKDATKGVDLFICSSKNGNHEADYILGFLYHEGKIVPKEIRKSINYYKEAFKDRFAKNNLGVIYKNEIWVAKNIHKKHFLQRDYQKHHQKKKILMLLYFVFLK